MGSNGNGMSDDFTTMNIRIEGEVQGCGFRDFAVREANARKLKGWVRNRADGSLEAVASGPTKQVEAFIAACMNFLGEPYKAGSSKPADGIDGTGMIALAMRRVGIFKSDEEMPKDAPG